MPRCPLKLGRTAQAAISLTPSSAAVGASVDLAKRVADDAAGDDRGGRGRGKDDGAKRT